MARGLTAGRWLPAAVILSSLILAAQPGVVSSAFRQGTPATTLGTDDPCAAVVAAGTPTAAHDEGHGARDPAEHSGEVGNPSDYPFDLVFIDAMNAHHEGAILTAEIALVRAEHEELRGLAQIIVETQAAEIVQLQDWRAAWYGDADPVPQNVAIGLMDEGLMWLGGPADTGSGMGGPVEGAVHDAYLLCTTSGSFDVAFIDQMIPHHQGAVGMSLVALERAEHPEVRALAEAIVSARQSEIAQMTEWRIVWSSETDGTPIAAG